MEQPKSDLLEDCDEADRQHRELMEYIDHLNADITEIEEKLKKNIPLENKIPVINACFEELKKMEYVKNFHFVQGVTETIREWNQISGCITKLHDDVYDISDAFKDKNKRKTKKLINTANSRFYEVSRMITAFNKK